MDKRYLVVKSWPDLCFNADKNILSKLFICKKDAEDFIARVTDKKTDPSNSVDFIRKLSDPIYEKEKEWWLAEEFSGFYNYDIVEIRI